MSDQEELTQRLQEVLISNRRGQFTSPAPHLYPHQWLWDSAFIAIGLRHFDVDQAQAEIDSLFRGQWSNGMLPHMIFSADKEYERDRQMWRSQLSPYAPATLSTSGITQPPMVAEAVARVAQKLPKSRRQQWLRQIMPNLIEYHAWLLDERRPHDDCLAINIHPYEIGLDNNPAWISQMHEHGKPWWIKAVEAGKLDRLVNLVRRDTRRVPPGQRMSNVEALMYWNIIRRFRKKGWDIDHILHRSFFIIEDVAFNSIFVRANQVLLDLAAEARITLDDDFREKIASVHQKFGQLWDQEHGMFYSRDFITQESIRQASVASLLPLYSRAISKEKAKRLVDVIKDKRRYNLRHKTPSVPLDSEYFDPEKYWQGPVWVNTNWLIIDGLNYYGYNQLAEELKADTLNLIRDQGSWEYFNPISGQGLGAANFSWTAGLGIDLLNS